MNKLIALVLITASLFASTSVFAQTNPYPTVPPTSPTTAPVVVKTYLPTSLHEGSKGAEVTDIQTKLATLGYYKGNADGMFGPITRQAVIQFQLDHALTADGVAGLVTRNKIASKITTPPTVAVTMPTVTTTVTTTTTPVTPNVTAPVVAASASTCLAVETIDDGAVSVMAGDMQKTLAHFVVKNTCAYAFTIDRLMLQSFSSYMRSHMSNIKIYAGSDKVNPHYFAALTQPTLQNGVLGQYFSIDATGAEAIAANTDIHILVKADIQDLNPNTLSGKNALVIGLQDFRVTGNAQTYSYGGSLVWGPRVTVTY